MTAVRALRVVEARRAGKFRAVNADPTAEGRTRVRYGRVAVDPVGLEAAIDIIVETVRNRTGGYVVTPNMAHLAGSRLMPDMEEVYDQALLSLADGVPLVWWSRLLGLPVREKVSGSDLIGPLLERAATEGLAVYLLGSQTGIATEATRRLTESIPGLRIVGHASPRVDTSGDQIELLAALADARGNGAQIVVLGLPHPKQEHTMLHHGWRVPGAVFVGAGASIDFHGGAVTRAPGWVSTIGLEWLYRLGKEPTRMWRRYLLECPNALPIFTAMWQKLRTSPSTAAYGPDGELDDAEHVLVQEPLPLRPRSWRASWPSSSGATGT